jgi:hypothetical protein
MQVLVIKPGGRKPEVVAINEKDALVREKNYFNNPFSFKCVLKSAAVIK